MRRFYVFAIFVLLIACTNGKNKPDVSDIKVDVRIDRFEQAFFKIDTNDITAGLADLRNGFPRFYPVFMRDILQVNPMDTNSLFVFRSIIGNYRPINDSVQEKYKNLGWLKDELEEAFKYVKYYYPNYKVPGIITFIATFDAPGIILTPDYLGLYFASSKMVFAGVSKIFCTEKSSCLFAYSCTILQPIHWPILPGEASVITWVFGASPK